MMLNRLNLRLLSYFKISRRLVTTSRKRLVLFSSYFKTITANGGGNIIMEKIEDFFSGYSKFDNLSQHCDFIRINDSFGNGRLYGFVWLLSSLLTVILLCYVKGNGKVKTLRDILYPESLHCFFLKLIYCLLPCLILPTAVMVMAVLIFIKQIVNIFLKLRYWNCFGGILASADSVWAIEDTSRNIISVLIILKPNPNRTENITRQMKDVIFQNVFQKWQHFPKLTSTRHRFMGFNFLLKNKLSVNDCVSTLEIKHNEELNQTGLQEIISNYCNQPLPKQHSALWQILVSPKPIQWHSKENPSNKYPVLLRFSHVVGDGLSFVNLMLRTFANSNTQETYKKLSFEKMRIYSSSKHLEYPNTDVFSKSVRATKNFVHTLSMVPSMLIQQHVLRKDDSNSLHGPKLCGEKNLVYAVEVEKKLFTLVKYIKKSIPNSKFSDILLAAVSRSLDEHFKRNSQPIPKHISVVIPALLSAPNMDQAPVLQNQFSVGILDLPIQMCSSSMLKRLQEVMQETSNLRSSLQYQVNYWLVTYLCGFIPHPILKQSLNTDQLTMTISNVPGVPKVAIMDDCDIEDIIFFTNHRGKTGVGLSILTYDDRFQLGLAIDKSIMKSRNEAQRIINDVFKYVEVLHAEVYKQNVSTEP